MVSWRRASVVGWVACSAMWAGCFEAPPEAHARLAAVRVEGEILDNSLDVMEERLLGNQARIQLWQELGRRHKTVSATACTLAGEHTQAIVAHEERQADKQRRMRRAKRAKPVMSSDAMSLMGQDSHRDL